MVFLHPPPEGLDHIFAVHRLLGSGLVAAAGGVAEIALRVLAVEVARHSALKSGEFGRIGVIIDHVHNNPDSVGVQGLDHLLEFPDADCGVVRVCGVGTFHGVVVLRVVAPVVLRLIQTGFIHGVIVVGRENLDIGHSELLEMVDAGGQAVGIGGACLGEGEEFTLVGDAGGRMDREVAVVHLIDDDVGRLDFRTYVFGPAFGVGFGPVDYGGTIAVHAHRLRCNALGFREPFAGLLHAEGVELAFEVFPYGLFPKALTAMSHSQFLISFTFKPVSIEAELHCISRWSPEGEFGLGVCIDTFFVGIFRDFDLPGSRAGRKCGHSQSTHNFRFQH